MHTCAIHAHSAICYLQLVPVTVQQQRAPVALSSSVYALREQASMGTYPWVASQPSLAPCRSFTHLRVYHQIANTRAERRSIPAYTMILSPVVRRSISRMRDVDTPSV